MKIEKINDKQIRCTLTLTDLTDFNIKLTDLAYGSDKARMLFRDMMLRAHREYGFEADNVPLMIEAVPGGKDSLTLIITKVDDPEELDTRFSRFTPDTASDKGAGEPVLSGADDVIDMYRKAKDSRIPTPKASAADKETPGPADLIRVFTFPSLDDVLRALKGIGTNVTGQNALYRRRRDGDYLLAVHKSGMTPEAYNRLCNMLSEYGTMSECTPAAEAHLREHEDVVIRRQALKKLEVMITR